MEIYSLCQDNLNNLWLLLHSFQSLLSFSWFLIAFMKMQKVKMQRIVCSFDENDMKTYWYSRAWVAHLLLMTLSILLQSRLWEASVLSSVLCLVCGRIFCFATMLIWRAYAEIKFAYIDRQPRGASDANNLSLNAIEDSIPWPKLVLVTTSNLDFKGHTANHLKAKEIAINRRKCSRV